MMVEYGEIVEVPNFDPSPLDGPSDLQGPELSGTQAFEDISQALEVSEDMSVVQEEDRVVMDLSMWLIPAQVTMITMFVALLTSELFRVGSGGAIPILSESGAFEWHIFYSILVVISIGLLIRASIQHRGRVSIEEQKWLGLAVHEWLIGALSLFMIALFVIREWLR